MPYKAPIESQPSISVPAGHRSKCRKCGAVDNVKLVGNARVKRCGACGSTLALRRAPKKPNIISFEVLCYVDGELWSRSSIVDRGTAELSCRKFVESGPVARVRVAQLVELLDGMQTGNVSVLRYDNYKRRDQAIVWVAGCDSCKGSGTVAVRIPQREGKALVKFVACGSCNGLGGELTREVRFRRFK